MHWIAFIQHPANTAIPLAADPLHHWRNWVTIVLGNGAWKHGLSQFIWTTSAPNGGPTAIQH